MMLDGMQNVSQGIFDHKVVAGVAAGKVSHSCAAKLCTLRAVPAWRATSPATSQQIAVSIC
eukprot:6178962-Pleurochrysis_carterae.AAC.2